MIPHTFWTNIIFISKVVGAVSVITGAGYGAVKFLSAVFGRVKAISTNVETLMNNHLPHVEKGITDMHTAMQGFSTSMGVLTERVEGFGTRLDDGKKEISDLSKAFVQHLQNVAGTGEHAGESSPAVKRGRRKQAAKTVESHVS